MKLTVIQRGKAFLVHVFLAYWLIILARYSLWGNAVVEELLAFREIFAEQARRRTKKKGEKKQESSS